MRVDVDEAGRDEHAFRIDLVFPARSDLADGMNFPARDGDIGFVRLRTRAVDDRSAAYNQVDVGHDVILFLAGAAPLSAFSVRTVPAAIFRATQANRKHPPIPPDDQTTIQDGP
jgi:hypothetical protein